MADKVVISPPTTKEQNIISTIITSGVHGIVLIMLLYALIYIVPQFKEVFSQIGLELPVTTVLILSVSDFLSTYRYLVPIMALLALALNAWIYYSLRSKFTNKRPSNFYRGIVLVAMLLCLAIMILALFLPLVVDLEAKK